MDDKDLFEALCGLMGSGRLDSTFIFPVLRDMSKQAGAAPSTAEMLDVLQDHAGSSFESLADHIKSRRRLEAARCHNRKKAGERDLHDFQDLLGDLPLDVPIVWQTAASAVSSLRAALNLFSDQLSLQPWKESTPKIAKALGALFDKASAEAATVIDPLTLIAQLETEQAAAGIGPTLAALRAGIEHSRAQKLEQANEFLAGKEISFPFDLDDGTAAPLLLETAAGAAPDQKRRALDTALAWPGSSMSPVIRQLASDPKSQERAALVLTIRFNEASVSDWTGYSAWLARVEAQDAAALKDIRDLSERSAAQMLLLWIRQHPEMPQEACLGLETWCLANTAKKPLRDVLENYAGILSLEERRILWEAARIPRREEGKPAKESRPRQSVEAARASAPPPVQPTAQAEPAVAEDSASLWNEHLLPFFASNWTMLTGIAMVVVGSSLLAFYTWDKHWFIRYTVLPALLAGFTVALARIGVWIEKRDEALKGTADMLRGAAIALLPVNFMAVAIAARDPQVPHKEWVLPIAALLYAIGFGWGLKRWCASVHPALRSLLGNSLLAINALVLVGPFAQVFDPSGERVWFLLGAGFHIGFLLAAFTIVRFAQTQLSPALIEEGRVPWFFGVTLTTTFLQVFLWVHGFMRHLPSAHTYACMVIAAGGLVLFAEQCSRSFQTENPSYGKDSFMGYALILLGLFMGASQPQIRWLTLELAGGIWLAQAIFRKDLLHAWIALTLLVLGEGSIGTWKSFPGPWIPDLGLVLAAVVGGSGLIMRRWWSELAKVARQMQAAVLMATTVLAVLVQWHYSSEPLQTAGILLASAGMFAWRAHRDQKIIYVHTAMAVLAVALPYLGFADMSGRTLHGNQVVFALSILSLSWIALTTLRRDSLFFKARSTVLLMYGAFALAAMCLRVYFEQGRPDDVLTHHVVMTLGGPLMMTAALLCAAFFSRSLIPNIFAGLILIILFPQLKNEIQSVFPFIQWGSGLMSGVWSVVLALSCFGLRSSPLLADLKEGDLFAGYAPFPLQRRDHTLFTWPLMAAAVLLLVKVDTWNLASHLADGGIHLRTAGALLFAGIGWTLTAVYFRADPWAKTLVHIGWVSAMAGLAFGYYDQAADPQWHRAALLCGGALTGLFLFYRNVLAPRRPWAEDLLAAPLRQVLRVSSLLLSISLLWGLMLGEETAQLWPLALYVSAELVWFSLADGEAPFATLLFFQSWAMLLAWAAPGMRPLLDRLTPDNAATPTYLLFLSVQAGHFLLEPYPDLHKTLRPLIAPLLFLASLGAFAVGAHGIYDATTDRALTFTQQGLLLAVVLSTARAQACGPLALIGMFLIYLDVSWSPLSILKGFDARLDLLQSPWRLSAFSLALACAAKAGKSIQEWRQDILQGRYRQAFFSMPAAPWLNGAAILFAACATLHQEIDSALRDTAAQLWTPYLSAGTFALVGFSMPEAMIFFSIASLSLALGNIQVVRFYLGSFLRAHGLMENHLASLGIAATLVQFSSAKRFLREKANPVFFNRACLIAAGFILALLTSTYFIEPNLEVMTETRFLLSGLMAYFAGRYFQRAARHPDAGEEPYAAIWEGAYHYAVTTTIWCAALLIPWLRNPYAAFPALGLPVLYFYFRAETSPRADAAMVARYRNTAAALTFFLLVLYTFRGAFQVVLFPGAPLSWEHYHYNAPFIMILALVMLRLHGLGGTPWLAFYGGLAMMVGSFFAVTNLPGLSPFDFPIPAAWCAFGLGHFWMLFGARPSPLKTFLQRISHIGDPQWKSLQRNWGLCLLIGTQICLLRGLLDYNSDTYMMAPLLLGGASLLAHQGYMRRSPTFFAFAALEVLAALHMDFFVASYLPKESVVWILLAIWAGFLVLAQLRPQGAISKAMSPIALCLGAFVLAHVFYHHPDSSAGLWAFAEGSFLAALTPRASRDVVSPEDVISSGILLVVPAWLTFWSQTDEVFPWATLAGTAAVFLTGCFARWVQESYSGVIAPWKRENPRLFDQTLSLLSAEGRSLNSALLYLVFCMTTATQVVHYGEAFDTRSLALILSLYGASTIAWYYEGQLRKSMPPYFLLQFCVLGFFAVLRRQWMLTLNYWNYEYDVWASLLVSFSLAGAKQVLPIGPREARIPLLGTLLAMPVAAILWVLIHNLGTDVVLLVVGLYSIMFAYMGKDDRESPYHIVAVGGFIAFILIVFWTKLELRVLQAYIIPVGLGILVLVQMFEGKIPVALRNEIRAITLLAMLASAGFYAISDDRYPMAFHMTLLVLSILIMAAGSFLRVRLYVLLGLAGILTDLGTIVYKVLLHMDRSARMSLIGTQVLILGAVLICGAIVYKTHQAELNAKLDEWRARLNDWE